MHPSDDELEEYALGRLTEAAAAGLEEHLLICESCRQRAEEMERYVDAMRDALRQARDKEEPC